MVQHNGMVWNCWTGPSRIQESLAPLPYRRRRCRGPRPSRPGFGQWRLTNFLTLWKEADREIPILQRAQVEYTKLQ